MNKLNLLAVATLVTVFSSPVLAQSISKVNGSVSVAAGQSIDEVSTVNGTIDVAKNAVIRDEISVVNGQITAAEGVRIGSISAVNGDIQIGENSSVGEVTTVNGAMKFGRKLKASDDLTSVNGEILVNAGSTVAGDVTSVNGSIGLIATNVTGKVTNVYGNTTVGVNSSVGGLKYTKPKGFSIRMKKRQVPRVIIGPRATVRGEMIFEHEVKLYVHSSAKVGRITGATAIPYSTDTAPKN